MLCRSFVRPIGRLPGMVSVSGSIHHELAKGVIFTTLKGPKSCQFGHMARRYSTEIGSPVGQKVTQSEQRRIWGKWHILSAGGLISTGLAIWYMMNSKIVHNDTDPAPKPASVNIDSSIDPLPKVIKDPLTATFQLLGYGIRTVTFLGMKVYALGVYIAKDDLAKVREVFNSRFLETLYEKDKDPKVTMTQKQALKKALEDDKLSVVLIDNLLNAGVRMTARICALRNTDLSHLRDGFVRTIKNSQYYKDIMKEGGERAEKLTQGLDELRRVMNSHHMKAYRNSRVFVEIIEGGKMRITVKVWDQNQFWDPVHMGVVQEPLVSRLLFLCYLSGPNPLVPAVRKTAAESLASLF